MYSNKYLYCIPGWITVEKNVVIPWDLEALSLQLKTDSSLGSNERIDVQMYKDSSYISNVEMYFSSPMQYWIQFCTNAIDLPVQPPVEVDKIWTIIKTETAIIVTCNGVEVLNYLFADSSYSDCVPKWGGDVVERIIFQIHDSASNFYRAGRGLDLVHTT